MHKSSLYQGYAVLKNWLMKNPAIFAPSSVPPSIKYFMLRS
ncbi:hypothetical protein B4065_1022 [Caldibacillus thermoamylovorans]|nr:hypothetical protein B4065_1022 [Caldibacillus thermoamylovorans]